MAESETKFVLNNSSAHLIIQWLRARCLPDPDFPVGIVSSIYYDTPGWQFLREKINSDYHKTKIRVRWYVDLNTDEPSSDSFLEAKYKIGSRRKKHRIKTGITGAWLSRASLDNRKLLEIPRMLWKKEIIIRGPLFPVFKIIYKRLRFIEPVTGMRVCIDYDICAPAVNRQMVPYTNPFQLSKAVFETKGSLTRLPETLHQLAALGCRKESFSKYAVCYKKIMRIVL
jgi:hypothetical protein